MTPEEQRIVLAEWDGWTQIHKSGRLDGQVVGYPKIPVIGSFKEVPDYTHDLNAVHELEWKLPKEAKERYNLELIFVETGYRLPEFWQSAVNSSAAQRCEALCRVLFPERFK